MPKFDWTKVNGYREEMTAEEKLALLDAEDALDAPPPTVSKAMFDKVSNELADAKKSLREKQTDEEAKEAERAAREAEREAELTALRREKMVNGYRASFLTLGYSEEMANQAAEALTDGKNDDVFAVLKQHNAGIEQEIRKKVLNETTVPPAGSGSSAAESSIRQAMGLSEK
jgi:hypothetical protein